MNRRRFVKFAGLASVAATGGLAGCQGGGDGTEDGTDGGTPSGGTTARYDEWVYDEANQTGEVFAASLDWQATPNLEGSMATASGEQSLQQDVLATTPVSWLFIAAFAVGLGLSQLGLDTATAETGPTEYVHVASGGVVLEGSYDTDSLSSSIEAADGRELEEDNGYTLYETTGGRSVAIALSDDTIVVVQGSNDGVEDPVARVKGIVDAGAGEKTLLSENAAAFDDVVTALPNRTVMGGIYSSEPQPLNQSTGQDQGAQTGFAQTDLDGEINALASSADVTQDGMTSAIAIRYAGEGEVNDRSAIEAAVGHLGTDQRVTVDGQLVVVEAEYDTVPEID